MRSILSINIQVGTPPTTSNCVCYTYINYTGLIEEDIKNIYDHAKWLHSFVQDNPSSNFI